MTDNQKKAINVINRLLADKYITEEEYFTMMEFFVDTKYPLQTWIYPYAFPDLTKQYPDITYKTTCTFNSNED